MKYKIYLVVVTGTLGVVVVGVVLVVVVVVVAVGSFHSIRI